MLQYKYKKFFLSNHVYRKRRTWKVWFMDKDEVIMTKSIEEMLGYMRNLYQQDPHTDLAVCELDKNHNLFIDGTGTQVSISISINRNREFLLGYAVSPFRRDFCEEIAKLMDPKIALKDFFSERKLGNRYRF